MFLRIWNYIRGYVMIEIRGFSVERFLNMAVHKGIYIWDVSSAEDEKPKKRVKKKRERRKRGFEVVKREKAEPEKKQDNGAVTFKVSVKGFKMLLPYAKKTKCRLRIKRKYGLPFLMFRYRKRKLLAAGVLFFLFALYYLSSFIWLVQIEGYSRLSLKDLEAFLASNGVYTGAFKYNVNTAELKKAMLIQFPDISWINIDIKGTRATVLLTETKPKTEPASDVPSDIIAAKDGLITGMATSSGVPLVKPGDVVKKGDVLVSGELTIGDESTGITKKYVHAVSDIRARLYYEMSFTVPLVYEEKVLTGRTKTAYTVKVFDREIALTKPKMDFNNYERSSEQKQLRIGEYYPFPVTLITTSYSEVDVITKERSVEQAEAIGNEAITNKILREFVFSADIIDVSTTFEDLGDCVSVTALITAIERIDEPREIELNVEQDLQEQ